MEEKEFKKVVKEYLKNEWPDFRKFHMEGNEEEWDEEGGLDMFKEVMCGFLSDMVVEVWAELQELQYNKSMRDKKEAEEAIEKVRNAIEELAEMVFDEEGTDLVEELGREWSG